VLAFNRFVVAPERTAEFTEQAHTALAALAARPGYRGGELVRALDDPARWCLVTRWDSVGAYRRALGSYEVKATATRLLASSADEPSAYEVLASSPPGGELAVHASDVAHPGELAGQDRHG